jgi:hypothetical protein
MSVRTKICQYEIGVGNMGLAILAVCFTLNRPEFMVAVVVGMRVLDRVPEPLSIVQNVSGLAAE